jgi:DNA-binding NarL/FixJ family response regulator
VARELEPISVLLADDDERQRQVVAAVLEPEDAIDLVGSAPDGYEAIALAQALLPDLILLDVRMPGIGGIEVAQAIHRLLPSTKVVMLTASDEDDDVFEALKAGAAGYLVKDSMLDDLPGAILAIAQGLGLLLSPSIASKLVSEFKDSARPSGVSSLSERELEVLRLVSLGHSNHEIAGELCLSSHTVKRHVANILAKLHQRSRFEAVSHAIRSGVLADAS